MPTASEEMVHIPNLKQNGHVKCPGLEGKRNHGGFSSHGIPFFVNALLCFIHLHRVGKLLGRKSDASENLALGAEGVIPSRQIEGFLRDFKQFTHNIPSGQIVN